ncbi:Signal recognition particle protein [Candidatus Azoamicus ciliaticola]|uniref:signal-recognition-particle GTPase n=2 Tax=Candidatus Azoamicus ciliaticola TaxID=2652803 RepID=A0A6J5JW82_9GAMM|nr:Signal recognition particle protein [Candidatus Azoamicus ciliaticola]
MDVNINFFYFMLENLTSKIGNILGKIAGKTRLTEYDIKNLLRDFRKTLLDSDVSWTVIKHLLEKIREKLEKIEIVNKASPNDIFIKIVVDEFLDIFKNSRLDNCDKLFKDNIGLSTILFIGLQGVGKTTSLVKLANFIKYKCSKSVLVVSCDVYRPAALEQLLILSNKVNINCFSDYTITDSPLIIVEKAIKYSRLNNYDFLIIDSAGRSHIDNSMMQEIIDISAVSKPDYSFLVVDSMVGQDGIRSADIFCSNIKVSGFFLTKMDGDSKGGVLLSLSFLMKKPIYFIGVGENIEDISYFYPDRIVSRILGFGDLSSLMEEINNNIGFDKNSSINKNSIINFGLDEFKTQLKYIIELGGIEKLLDKIPGGYSVDKSLVNKFDNKFFSKMIAIINSMTIKEKKFPSLINGSRKRRISLGSGVDISDISKMLKYYEKMKKSFLKVGDEKSFLDKMKKKIL